MIAALLLGVCFCVFISLAYGAAVKDQGCTYKGQKYSNLATIPHDNGCAILQCQFGKIVTYYEACGKDVDGQCHRLNVMFVKEGHTYQCVKAVIETVTVYINQIAIPRTENCTFNGKVYTTQEKFRRGDGCLEYQCQNGVIYSLDAVCGKEIDGQCHLLGEHFQKDGKMYTCTSREDNGVTVYENKVLNDKPVGNRQCVGWGLTLNHLEVFKLPLTCIQRQCEDKSLRILSQSCVFKQNPGVCYAVGELWTFQKKTYMCNVNQTDGSVKTEIIDKGFGKCKRAERWYSHLEIQTRLDGCTSVQCQDGKTPPVQEGCLSSADNKCHDLNMVFKIGRQTQKCIRTSDGLYRIVDLDENGDIIEKEVTPTKKPDFGENCDTIAADIVFILDSSGSITRANYERQLNFSCDVLSAFKIGPDNVRVGTVIFSDKAEKVFDLKTYPDYVSTCKAIRSTPFLGDTTETQKAFNLIVNDGMFETKSGGRPNIPDIVITITDGNSTNTSITIAAADRLKARGVQIITIGIGHVDKRELYGIASRPENVFNTSSYEAIYSLKEQISNRTCNVPVDPPVDPEEPATIECPKTAADVIFILDSSSDVGAENYAQKLELAINFTKQLTVSSEYVQVGAVLVSSPATKLFDLNKYSTRSAIVKALRSAPYLQGDRDTHDAIQIVRDGMFSSASGGRSTAARIVIILIDGASSNLNKTLTQAKQLRNEGVQVLTIGIGDYAITEIIGLSGQEKNIFGATSYTTLNFVKNSIYKRICEATKEPRPDPEPPRCSDTVVPPCNHFCENTVNGYTCSCRRGFEVNTIDKTKCDDKNECKEVPKLCQQLCLNTEGSYACSCKEGYVVSPTNQSNCIDVDECLDSPCHQVCTNTPGSFLCSCDDGFQVSTTNPKKCEDKNECKDTSNPCQQQCDNTVGSYVCSCKEGYVVSSTDRSKCSDVDECLSFPCEQECTNTDGSFECSCEDGYKVSPTDSSKCEDINECDDEENPPCHHHCTNTIPGYRCHCKDGYVPNECDENTCKDIDECLQNPCPGKECQNTRGDYNCI